MEFKFTKFILLLCISNLFYNFTNARCGRDNVLRVGVLSNNQPFFDQKNGTAFGFDVLLVREIASRLGYRNVRFVRSNDLSNLFNQLNNNSIDLIGTSNVVINTDRLQNFGFVETDNNPLPCQPLVFLNSVSGLITSPSTALDDIAANNLVVGSFGPGSIQYRTLEAHGVNPSNIINVQSFSSSFESLFNHFGTGPGQYQALYFFKEKDVADAFTSQFSSTVRSFDCVELLPTLQGFGDGYVFNKRCCRLMIQFQRVLDQIIADGTYARFIRKTLNNLCISAEAKIGLGTSLLIAPEKNASRQQGFIPTSCCNL